MLGLTSLLLLVACRSAEVRDEVVAPVPTGPAAHDKLDAVAWTQGSAEFQALSLQAFGAARRAVESALDDPAWDALPPDERNALGNRATLASLPLAVIADVDETLLDNTPFNVRLIRDPIPGDLDVSDSRAAFDRRWEEWVSDERAVALPGSAAFARHLLAGGIALVYVTNREDGQREATCRNLVAEGFPVPDCETFVLTKNDDAGRPSAKGSRRAVVGQRYRILALIGDNLGDFEEGVETDLASRRRMVDEHQGWWGERWVVLPNPIYGSWEKVAGKLPPDAEPRTLRERESAIRTAKEAALDDRVQE